MRHWWILYLLFFPLLHCAGNTGLLDSDYSTVDGRIAFVGPGDFTSFKIFVMRPDGDGLMRLTSEKGGYTNPSWSPNARRVVFASNRDALGNFDIYIFNLEDRGIQKVVDLPGPDLGPAWSPDGGKIAFQAQKDNRDRWDIYTVNLDGTGLQNLTNSPSSDEAPDWSPDGRRIAFQSRQGNNIDIFLMDSDGSNRVRLTDFNGVQNIHPAWSPDGSRIAFASNRHQPQVRNQFPECEIYTMDSDGTMVRRLTLGASSTVAFFSPTWSPDGQRIAFEVRRSHEGQGGLEHRLMMINADGTDLHEVSVDMEVSAPRWSPRQTE